MNEAGAIAAMIERRHYVTGAMGDECSSACVLAWAAGGQKFVAPRPVSGSTTPPLPGWRSNR